MPTKKKQTPKPIESKPRRKVGGLKAGGPVRRQRRAISPDGEPGLTPAKEQFATLIAKGESQTEAYLTAFPQSRRWTKATVYSKSSALAADDKVRDRISELMASAAKANEADVALVLREYLTRLRADPRELTEVRVSACRFCWGAGHRRQLTDGELADARAHHEDLRLVAIAEGNDDPGEFDERGGGGYSRALAPNPECPTCGGDGEARVRLRDSSGYSEGALALFAGVKETKEGIEVKLADRDNALLQVARHVNFFEQDNAVEVGVSVNVSELESIYAQAMERAQLGREAAMGRMGRIAAQTAEQPKAEGDGK